MFRFCVFFLWRVVFTALLVLPLLVFADFGSLRPAIEQQAGALLGDKVRVAGHISVGLLHHRPALVLHEVEVGPDTRAGRVELTLRGLKLERGVYVRVEELRYKVAALGDYALKIFPRPDGFTIDPLEGTLGAAAFKGKLSYAGKNLKVEGALHGLPLGLLVEEAEGKVEGKVVLEAEGENGTELLRTLQGRVLFNSGSGKLTSKSLNFWSRGIVSSLIPGKKDATKLNCAIVDFDIKKGVATSRAVVIDTADNTLFLKGKIELPTEKMKLDLIPNPKGIDPLSVATPLRIAGTFDKPTVTPIASGVARKIGGMLLGMVNPAFAVLPLIESKFSSYSGSCADILKKKGR